MEKSREGLQKQPQEDVTVQPKGNRPFFSTNTDLFGPRHGDNSTGSFLTFLPRKPRFMAMTNFCRKCDTNKQNEKSI